MTKEQLLAANEAQREMIAALGAELDALYDIFTAVRESPRDTGYVVGYAGSIGGEYTRGNIPLLRAHAAALRQPAPVIVPEPVQDRHADLDPGELGGMSDAEFYDITGRTA